jgi:hypothetical protein
MGLVILIEQLRGKVWIEGTVGRRMRHRAETELQIMQGGEGGK